MIKRKPLNEALRQEVAGRGWRNRCDRKIVRRFMCGLKMRKVLPAECVIC